MKRAALIAVILSGMSFMNSEAVEDVAFRSEVDGTEQRYVELLPPGFDAGVVHDLVLALHGHGADRWQFIKETRSECKGLRDVAARRGLIVVSPDYRAKTSWMGPQAEADVMKIISESKRRHKVGRVFIAGASMGGTGALIFASLHPDLIDGVCSLNGLANMVEFENFQEAISASYGGGKTEVPEEYKKRSAEFWSDRFTMPVAITSGGQDKSVPPQSVLRLADDLQERGRKVLSLHDEQGGHSTSYEHTVTALEFMLSEAGVSPAPGDSRHPNRTD